MLNTLDSTNVFSWQTKSYIEGKLAHAISHDLVVLENLARDDLLSWLLPDILESDNDSLLDPLDLSLDFLTQFSNTLPKANFLAICSL